mmetsp:Transcript_14199/g.22174  ORF Transcript_14199/g.22174 Transcript_14199/m.22174 type:complete len:224 (+) Transcript_14199:1621-2292(+)
MIAEFLHMLPMHSDIPLHMRVCNEFHVGLLQRFAQIDDALVNLIQLFLRELCAFGHFAELLVFFFVLRLQCFSSRCQIRGVFNVTMDEQPFLVQRNQVSHRIINFVRSERVQQYLVMLLFRCSVIRIVNQAEMKIAHCRDECVQLGNIAEPDSTIFLLRIDDLLHDIKWNPAVLRNIFHVDAEFSVLLHRLLLRSNDDLNLVDVRFQMLQILGDLFQLLLQFG